ncbi:MAG: type transport system permease protein [Actinomycetota bacterium]|jgi:ABC-2 type transport system permease protein
MSRSLESWRLLLRWQYERFRPWLPMMVTIQVLLAVGVIYGLALLVPDIDRGTALYLATGAPTLSLVILGLNVVPQEVSQGRLTGRHDYWRTLPVPRLAPLAAEVTFWLLLQLPGTALALVVAAIRFDVGLHIGWAVVPAIVLVALTGAAVGYGLAATLPPQVTGQVTSFLSIVILLFSPINFPADRLPGFLQVVHRVLPIQYMADVMRGSLTGRYDDPAVLAFVVVGCWCIAGLAVSYRAAVRRP